MATLVMGALLPWRVLTTQLTRTTMYAGLVSQISMPYDFCVAGGIEHSVRLPRPALGVILNACKAFFRGFRVWGGGGGLNPI